MVAGARAAFYDGAMTRLLWLLVLAACGGPSSTWSPPSTGGTEAVVAEPQEVQGAAHLLAILGGLLMAVVELNMTPQDYITSIWQQLSISDIFSGLGKTVFFGLEIAAIGCYNGLQAQGGAASVGQATTRTVVLASICVLISDFFLTKLFLAI